MDAGGFGVQRLVGQLFRGEPGRLSLLSLDATVRLAMAAEYDDKECESNKKSW